MASVLIVDDDVMVTRALGRTLRLGGHVVRLLNDPTEALAYFGADPPDVVIADQRMPGVTGLQLLRRVRLRWPLALRVMCSAQGEVGAQAAGLIHGYVSKPWINAAVLSLVAELINARHAA